MIDPIVADNFNRAFSDLLCELKDSPDHVVNPRKMGEVREILVPTLVLEDPRNRLITIPAREANYGFGVGEFLWYWRGADDLESLKYYNKRAGMYSDDGLTVNSAYGKRLLTWGFQDMDEPRMTQWDVCKSTLIKDPDSRRAVMTIYHWQDGLLAETAGTKDVPCTLSLQFFIRNNELILHSHMRSNDVMWGLTYDAFSFTLMQEVMYLQLKEKLPDLRLGAYYHTAGSMHLYERHYQQAAKIIGQSLTVSKGAMEPIDLDGLERLVKDEELLRTGKVENIDPGLYEGGCRWMAEQLNAHRRKRDAEAVRQV